MFSTQLEPADASPMRPWPVDQPERWPIEWLTPYAANPRVHTEADIDKIAASILKWGWTMPVLADENGMPIAGEVRIAAAVKVGLRSSR
jgi:ParB-like chromosome segregation protein Spo0J